MYGVFYRVHFKLHIVAVMPVCGLTRIVKDVPADSKEGKQALQSSAADDLSQEKSASADRLVSPFSQLLLSLIY